MEEAGLVPARATIYDVAKVAGVSAKTVSNVLNDFRYVRDSTRQRVQEAMVAVNYRPNSSARNLRLGRTGIISLSVSQMALPYSASLTADVVRSAEAQGWSVLIEQSYEDPVRERQIVFGPLRQRTDGLIVASPVMSVDDPSLEQLTSPTVFLGGPGSPGLVSSISVDNRAASAAATRHLLDLGRARIAVLGWADPATKDYRGVRAAGHVQALTEAGVDLQLGACLPVDGEWNASRGFDAAVDLLGRGVAFDAVRCMNDALALGALRAFRAHGVDVPSEAAVVGFDDLPEDTGVEPTLSTVSTGRMSSAQLAVDMLAEQCASSSPAREHRSVVLPFAIIQRGSTNVRTAS